MLTGYLTPSAGTARIGGLDVVSHRIEAAARIGYLPENGPLYPEMTPLELLEFFGSARGLAPDRLKRRIDEVVGQCHLEAVLEKSIFKLSRGYRQRVGMAQALLHEPDILIMDEPTSGLDPNQIRDVRQLIRGLGETKTILISTHILQEVEAMVDHVILVNEGRVVFDGTVDEMASGESLEAAFPPPDRPVPRPGPKSRRSRKRPHRRRVKSPRRRPGASRKRPVHEASSAEAASPDGAGPDGSSEETTTTSQGGVA